MNCNAVFWASQFLKGNFATINSNASTAAISAHLINLKIFAILLPMFINRKLILLCSSFFIIVAHFAVAENFAGTEFSVNSSGDKNEAISVSNLQLNATEEISAPQSSVQPKSNSTGEGDVVFKENISFALLFRLHGEKAGGSLEFGFPILKNTKYLYMRGYATFEIAGGHLPEYGFLTLAGGFKFQAGGKVDRQGFRFVVYGFFAPQFGGLASGGLPSEKPPIYLELAGGAGFEFFFSPTSSFFIEYGGGCYIPFGDFKQNAGTMFTVGHRRFFK